MRRIVGLVIGGLALGGVARVDAQQCSNAPPGAATAACNAAVDAYKTFQPLAGVAISGGNPVLGTARTLGGLGHLFLSARINAVKAVVPLPSRCW